jgi:hypothetical protein
MNTDLAAGLTNCLCKDGQSTPINNIPMGGFKLSGLGVATTQGDAASYGNPINFSMVGIGMTPVNILDIAQNQNAISTVSFLNNSTGNGAIARFLLGNSAGGNMSVGLTGGNYTTSALYRTDMGLVRADGAGGLMVGTGAAQPVYFGINNVEKMRLDATGQLGIGMVPTAPLSVFRASDGAIADFNAPSAGVNTHNLRFIKNGVFQSAIGMDYGGGYLVTTALPNSLCLRNDVGPISFATLGPGGEAMRLYQSGSLCMADAPADFHDYGGPATVTLASGTGGILRCMVGSGAPGNPSVGLISSPDYNGVILQSANATVQPYVRFNNTNGAVGNITCGTGTAYNTTSDGTLKNFNVPQRDFRAMARAIHLSDGEWLAEPGRTFLTFSAQQIWDAGYKECITPPDLRDDTETGAKQSHWMAEKGALAPLALWGVQDLYKFVEAQAAKINDLEARLAVLERTRH